MQSYCYEGFEVYVYFSGKKVKGIELTGRKCRGGEKFPEDLEIDLSAFTPFERRIIRAAMKIPRGKVATYKALAEASGNPKASRAAGRVMSKNPFPIVVPCHRVVRSDLSLGGYAYGSNVKRGLLEAEGVRFKRGKIDKSSLLRVI